MLLPIDDRAERHDAIFVVCLGHQSIARQQWNGQALVVAELLRAGGVAALQLQPRPVDAPRLEEHATPERKSPRRGCSPTSVWQIEAHTQTPRSLGGLFLELLDPERVERREQGIAEGGIELCDVGAEVLLVGPLELVNRSPRRTESAGAVCAKPTEACSARHARTRTIRMCTISAPEGAGVVARVELEVVAVQRHGRVLRDESGPAAAQVDLHHDPGEDPLAAGQHLPVA